MRIEPKTIDEQIFCLKNKGLIIDDPLFAKEILSKKNYYNIVNAFKDIFFTFKDDNEKFIKGTKFIDLYNFYKFDIKLRNLFLKYILCFENEFKTNVSLCISSSFNHAPYFDNAFYEISKNNIQSIKRIKDKIYEISTTNNNDSNLHFLKKGYLVPTWVLFNHFNFGDIRSLYMILNESLKVKIANKYNVNPKELISFLSLLNIFRNVCAHSNRLYNFKINDIDKSISDTPTHTLLKIPKGRNRLYVYGKKDLFAVVIVFKYLLSEDDFDNFIEELRKIITIVFNEIKVIPNNKIMYKMGFPIKNDNCGMLDWYCIKQ